MQYTTEEMNNMSAKELHEIMKANGYIVYGVSRSKAALIDAILTWQQQRKVISKSAL